MTRFIWWGVGAAKASGPTLGFSPLRMALDATKSNWRLEEEEGAVMRDAILERIWIIAHDFRF